MSWKEGTSASTNLVLFGLTLDVNNLGPWLERECHDYPSMYVNYKASGFLEFPFDQQFNIFHHISTISELQDHVTTCLNLCKFYNYDYNTIKKIYMITAGPKGTTSVAEDSLKFQQLLPGTILASSSSSSGTWVHGASFGVNRGITRL